jgi:hypothetical protein
MSTPPNPLTELAERQTKSRPTVAWAFWHPRLEWGLPVPVLWASKELAVERAKETGVWPPQHGWQLIPVTVARAASENSHG